MDIYELQVETRTDPKARDVRAAKRIPAVFYGAGQKNRHLTMNYEEFRKILQKAGESSIIELQMEGGKVPVLVHEVQRHPISDKISHVDFIYVDMNKEVTTHIPLRAVGIAPAVKDMSGVLSMALHEVEVRCLPKYLVHDIEVDVTTLIDFGCSIHVSDLKVPEGMEILDDAEQTVATVSAPRAEEEAPAPAEGETVEGEVEGETVEGAAEGEAGSAGEGGNAPKQEKQEKGGKN